MRAHGQQWAEAVVDECLGEGRQDTGPEEVIPGHQVLHVPALVPHVGEGLAGAVAERAARGVHLAGGEEVLAAPNAA